MINYIQLLILIFIYKILIFIFKIFLELKKSKNFQYFNIEKNKIEYEHRCLLNRIIITIQKFNFIKNNSIFFQLFSKFANYLYQDSYVKFIDKNKHPIREIKKFCKNNGINYDENNWIWKKKPIEFESINDFFMRRLKNEIIEQNFIVSPVTGIVIKYKSIYDIGVSIKGDTFNNLLLNDQNLISNTCYYFYLSPADYHCFHSPIEGFIENIEDLRFTNVCSGSVKPDLLNSKPNIIFFNKRYIITLRKDNFKLMMVIIGGFNTDSIIIDSKIIKGSKINKGDYIGSFGIGGSAVLLLTNTNILIDAKLDTHFENKKIPIKIHMGENFGKI